ncbi:MAG: aspartate aminotransferase family protein [Candidatus Hodarchaeota archaeon]
MNYEDLMSRLRNLADIDPIPVPEAVLQKSLKEFSEKFKKSKEMSKEFKKYIPGGVEHQNAIKYPFTITLDKGEGCHLWDIDGNRFIDYLMASGPIILGHNYPEVRDYVINIIKEKGSALGMMCEYELLAAKEIVKHFKSVEQVRFYQTGTETAMAAARLARCYTGKDYIVKVGGSYHGWSDQFVYDLHLPGTANAFAYGIPNGCLEKTLSIKPNDLRRLEKLLKRYGKEGKGGIAAVFLEGGGGDGMTHYVPPEFYKRARELCDEHGALLVMDEVITGFRLAMGGAQEYFGVDADLTMMGKIVGHQYPSAGALGGPADIMRYLASQAESVDESGNSIEKSVMSAGTLAGTTITCAAAYKAIQCIEKTDAINVAGRAADKISKGLNDIFERNELPFFSYNFKSIMHCPTSNFYFVNINRPDALKQVDIRRKIQADYVMLQALEGIISLQSMRFYTSLQHDKKEVYEETFAAFENFCKKLKT